MIQLTEKQQKFIDKILCPTEANMVNDICSIDFIDFGKLPWYIIGPTVDNIPTTCDNSYPYSLQVLYRNEWYEIDVITEKLLQKILKEK